MTVGKSRPTNKGFKLQKLYLVVVALIVAITGYSILYQGRAATPSSPSIYLSSSGQTPNAVVGINKEFTVELRADSGSIPVKMAEASFAYDADRLEYVGSSYNPGLSTSPYQWVNPFGEFSDGTIHFVTSVGPLGSPNQTTTGDQLIATITFRSKSVGGSTSLSFNNSNTSLIRGDTGGDVVMVSGLSVQGLSILIDTEAPTVSIDQPANNSAIAAGSTQTISISADDNSGVVDSVELYIDDDHKATLNNAPYTYSWDTTGAALGNHTLRAVAKDSFGNTGESQVVTVSIGDVVPPTVSITLPTSGATVKGAVQVVASASDNEGGSGVSRVEFMVGDSVVATDTDSPYSFTWDTTSLPDGNHVLRARAYDGANNTAISSPVNVTVENVDSQAPTTPANLRIISSSAISITLAWDASVDNIGVANYIIKRDGVQVSTTTSLHYEDTGLAGGASYSYQVAAVDAAGNTSASATISAETTSIRPGDFDENGKVDAGDLAGLLGAWSSTASQDLNRYDLNDNGIVDIFDLSILLHNWTG